MTISAANLQFRLSGGAGNTAIAASLGGAMSTAGGGVITSQNTTALSGLAGVSISYCGGAAVGPNNSIRHTYSGGIHYLSYMDALDGSYGSSVAVSVDGTYFLAGANRGSVAVIVAVASLPLVTQVGTFTATNNKNNLWDDVAKTDALNGSIEYRCIFLFNSHLTETFLQVSVFGYAADGNPAAAGDKFYVAPDSGGTLLGDGSTNAAVTIANESTAPSGVVFSSPTLANPLVMGAIGPLQSRALWMRRNVQAALYATTPDDYVAFGTRLIF